MSAKFHIATVSARVFASKTVEAVVVALRFSHVTWVEVAGGSPAVRRQIKADLLTRGIKSVRAKKRGAMRFVPDPSSQLSALSSQLFAQVR